MKTTQQDQSSKRLQCAFGLLGFGKLRNKIKVRDDEYLAFKQPNTNNPKISQGIMQ